MKRHLIKFTGSSEMDYTTTTYCGMYSDKWSEEFRDNTDTTLTTDVAETTCKRCISAYKKDLSEFEKRNKYNYEKV
jgi:hypothetical protein